MPTQLSKVIPSLFGLNIPWPRWANSLQGTSQLQVSNSLQVRYYVQTSVSTAAIIEWNIGIPLSGQIRQTAADRTDFAY